MTLMLAALLVVLFFGAIGVVIWVTKAVFS